MEKLDLYRCEICGNLVEVIIPGGGELVCCGEPMHHIEGKNKEEMSMEKHLPVFVKNDDNKSIVRVGKELHPMDEGHYIMFIETISEDKKDAHLHYLSPGDKPEMILEEKFGKVLAREFCNLHGLWEGESD